MAKGAKNKGVVVWGLMALLVLGLGGFGVTNFGGTLRSIATVGDREISVDDYAQALQRDLRNLTQQIGQPITMAQMQAFGRDATVRAALIGDAALDHEAARIGVSAGDEQVRAQITAAPEFQSPDGKFDRQAYAFTLEQQRMSEAEFETDLREGLARGILAGAVAGGVATPEVYGAMLSAWATETRDLTHAALIAADLVEPVAAPTEEALKAHYEADIAAFTSPETRELTYIWLRPEDLLATLEVDEAVLRTAYEARLAEYVTPERRLVERLVFASEADAAVALARITAGTASFADLAAERGLTLNDLDLGDVAQADLGAAGAAVFALTAPGVVGPLPTDLGPALFAMNAILAAQEVTFEAARPELETTVALDRARRQILDQSADIEDLLAGGATLEEVAAEAGMTLGKISLDATTEDDIAAYSGFREVALAVTVADYPTLAELDDGGIFALRLDAIHAPAPIPLEDVRADVVTAWTKAETTRQLVLRGDEMLAALAAGATLESLGLVVTRHDGLTRQAFVEGLPAPTLAQAFALPTGGHAVVEADGVHLVRVDSVTVADPADPDVVALRGSIDTQVARTLAEDIRAAYVAALQAEAGVSLNPTAIEAVHAQLR